MFKLLRHKIVKEIKYFAKKRGYIISKMPKPLGSQIKGLEFTNLNFGFYFDTTDYSYVTLFLCHEGGIFSCFTIAMWLTITLQLRGLQVSKIDNTYSMNKFKNNKYTDTYSDLFEFSSINETPPLPDLKSNPLKAQPHCIGLNHDYHEIIYNTLGIEWLGHFLNKYMKPCEAIKKEIEYFDSKYEISRKDTIFVCYRGTDKYKEVEPTSISKYFEVTDKIIQESNEKWQILIQTDQAQIRHQFISKYRDKCIFISELPVTKTDIAIHHQDGLISDKNDFSKKLIAAVMLSARSKILLTNSGNLGFFLAAYISLAGKDFIQIDKDLEKK